MQLAAFEPFRPGRIVIGPAGHILKAEQLSLFGPRSDIKAPGSRGGTYFVDQLGKIHYGTPPLRHAGYESREGAKTAIKEHGVLIASAGVDEEGRPPWHPQRAVASALGYPSVSAYREAISPTEKPHIGQPQFNGVSGMQEFYSRANMLPTSTDADSALIRSHIMYHSGHDAANRAEISPSRGHSYRVKLNGHDTIVRIGNHYDHRDGVTGWTDTKEQAAAPTHSPAIQRERARMYDDAQSELGITSPAAPPGEYHSKTRGEAARRADEMEAIANTLDEAQSLMAHGKPLGDHHVAAAKTGVEHAQRLVDEGGTNSPGGNRRFLASMKDIHRVISGYHAAKR